MIADLGNGLVSIDGQVVEPMPGFPGPFSFAETGSLAYVAAGKGGGPRMAVYRRRGALKLVDDFWPRGSADVTSRAGVVPAAVREEPIVYGPDGWFPVVLDCERPFDGPWYGDVASRVFALLAGCEVQVRTTRPKLLPYRYGVCLIGAELPQSATEPHPGFAPVSNFALPPQFGEYEVRQVWAAGLTDVAVTAGIAVHEVLHGFGEAHTIDPGDVMNGVVGPLPSSRVSDASRARVLARTTAYRSRL